MTATFVSRSEFEALRAPRPIEARFDGLYAAGEIGALARPVVAIVGTRAATPYGKRAARAFAQACGRAGCCILSGLAVGIDKAAHEGALEAGAPTIGVLGGGHEHFYPKRNLALAQRMLAEGGGVLSPFSPERVAHPPQFLQRNGVVAALADAVVVIEAPARSGALNTATWAAGHIPVFAVPGDIDRPHVQGCLNLIRDGAILARTPDDVLEVLRLLPLPLEFTGPQTSVGATRNTDIALDPNMAFPEETTAIAKAILERLTQGECDIDTLADALHYTPSEIMSSLTLLEMANYIEACGSGMYARK